MSRCNVNEEAATPQPSSAPKLLSAVAGPWMWWFWMPMPLPERERRGKVAPWTRSSATRR